MLKKFLLAVSALASVPAIAATNVPLPSNAYITMGGLDWAWAAPLPHSSFTNPLSYQGGLGWRLPTAAELAAAPLATDFLFAGGNVPFNGSDPISGSTFSATNGAYTGDGACAAGYFDTQYTHCDWQDGLGQTYGPWAGMPNAYSFAEQLYVRDASGAIPEPATWAMLIVGFGLVGFAARRNSAPALA